MPDWASLAVAVGIWSLLLVFARHLVMKLTGSPFNAGASEPASLFTSAQERSFALLREMLEEHEYEQLTKRGYLDISSPSNPQRIYRIRRDVGLVSVYKQGKAAWELCVQPTEPLPEHDLV